MTSFVMIFNMVVGVIWWIIIIQAIMSWLISFNVLNIRQPFVYQVWSTLNRLTEPIYRPIRNMLPNMGGIDITPVIVLVGHITKEGAAVVRAMLTEAVWQAVRRSPTVRAYQQRIERGDPDRRKVSIVATAHYLVRVMWSMLKNGTVWRELEPVLAA